MTAIERQEIAKHIQLSLPPTHLLLVLLDEAQGEPRTEIELSRQLEHRISSNDGLLGKYIDIQMTVEDDLRYLESLQLIERMPMSSGFGAKITMLGSFIAMSLQPV